MLIPVVLTLLPIALIVFLMIKKNYSADASGIVGWMLTMIITFFFFGTTPDVALRSSLAGIIASFPVSLMVVTSILQITFMEATGALRRIAVFVKTFGSGDRAVQIMLINVGAGHSWFPSARLRYPFCLRYWWPWDTRVLWRWPFPAIGFDALCTFALLGAPLVVYSDLTGTPLVQSAQVFAKFLPVISTLIGFGMLWIVGRWKLMREGFIPCIIAG